MKCPRCGHWNKPTFPRCFQCGELLNTDESPKASWRDQFNKPKNEQVRRIFDDAEMPEEDITVIANEDAKQSETLASEMNRLKNRRARGMVYLEEFRKNAAEQGIAPTGSGVSIHRADGFFAEVPDNPEETVYEPPEIRKQLRGLTQKKQSVRIDLEKTRPYKGYEGEYAAQDEYMEDLPPALGAAPPLSPQPSRRRKRLHRRQRGPVVLVNWVVRILIIMAVGVTIWQGAQIIQNSAASVPVSDETVDAHIEAIEVDGSPGRRIRISGEEGTQFYISELSKSYVVVDGVATIEVGDYVFYEGIEHLEAAQMEVTLTPTRVRGGDEKRLAPIRYTIDVPLSPIKLIMPESNYVKVSASIYNMQIMVASKSKVYINGVDATDQVKDDGVLTHNASIQARGEFPVTITARAPRCRENNMTVIFYREPQEIALELAIDTMTKTSLEEMTIYAGAMIGASVMVESPIVSLDDRNLNTTGAFSFVAKMERVGLNVIRIRASYPGMEDSVLEHVVTYLPPPEIYTKKAWALAASDYAELLNNITMRAKNAQIYLCEGTIAEILSEKPQLAIMNTGTEEKPQLVFLENQSYNPEATMTTMITWEVGKAYRVYADTSGLYNSMPKLVGRYSYPK